MHMLRAAHFDHAVANLGEGTSREIKLAARAGQMVGVGFLVEGVRRSRFGGEFSIIRQGFQHEGIFTQNAHRAVRAGAGGRGNRRAFEDLAAMQRQPFVVALHDRQGSKTGRVVGATGEHHLSTGLQGADEGLHPGLRDDVGTGVNGFVGEWRHEIERDDLPGIQCGVNGRLVDVGGNHRHLEADFFLGSDFEDDLSAPFEVRRSPGAAGRADNHRDAGFHPFADHVTQVALDAGAVGKRLARAQIVGAGVGRTGIDGDQVGLFRHTALEAFFREAVAQNGCRREDFEFGFHGNSV